MFQKTGVQVPWPEHIDPNTSSRVSDTSSAMFRNCIRIHKCTLSHTYIHINKTKISFVKNSEIISQVQCLEALGMVPCLTHCCRFSYTSASSKAKCLEPLATFISRRLGKHRNLHVVWAQADLDGFITSSWDRLKQRSSQQGLQSPCVLRMFETGSRRSRNHSENIEDTSMESEGNDKNQGLF